ncbi:large-conductance mechanosensitive channel protein MscL [Muribaculum sp.]|uniref:large-conductance mechanosensitive channel protein MscL n=1 Tax=Muribaculum sp. TaxID=1918611 RepID=UPI0023C431C0|nr:large-conductance mechanosensitive channel protein MscL [Muribaculum sp.]MDE5704644.1 large-conductance mechanosensitive channel protein MscL [Muribaculum sp.]
MGKFLTEFKEFAMKGNVIDMAVGVIIGGAFGKIVTSLVNDIIMPVVGIATGGVNFKDHKILLKAAETAADGTVINPEVMLTWGMFVQSIVDFLIIAFCIFVAIRWMNKLKKATIKAKEEAPAAAAPAEPTKEEQLLTEIRDLLKAQTREDKK